MKNLLAVLLLATTTVFFVACGGDDATSKEETTETTEKKKKSEPEEVQIVLLGNDQMKYNKEEIKVKAGDKIKLIFKHSGTMDKQSMGHNFVLLKAGVDVTDFATKAMTARDNDYIPEDEVDNIIAYTELLGGGEVTTIRFDAPEPGTYDYICTFPGHYSLMKGKFIVEASEVQ